ncbi:hypothetical protein ZIOFF_060235 [Zingiber officinale]|uniref:Uncharacterized protein n=1 Tax=Zingiber officinale TaxID=94328 RepID=A0A8J5KL12_ZINOF|nr:hypothetical protein ZIOFF_060235 [Zingiber officinale]
MNNGPTRAGPGPSTGVRVCDIVPARRGRNGGGGGEEALLPVGFRSSLRPMENSRFDFDLAIILCGFPRDGPNATLESSESQEFIEANLQPPGFEFGILRVNSYFLLAFLLLVLKVRVKVLVLSDECLPLAFTKALETCDRANWIRLLGSRSNDKNYY